MHGPIRQFIRTRIPGIQDKLANSVVQAINKLRSLELKKPPSITETLDWAKALGYQKQDRSGLANLFDLNPLNEALAKAKKPAIK